MSMPLVSAIMPVYNAAEFLEDAIASALAQDYEPFEIVACDDGSTDRSLEILMSHPEVRVLRQENQGPAAARNAAIAASSGEYVAMFDADDTWPTNRITIQATHLREHPEVGCVLGRQEWIDPPPWLRPDAVYGELDGIPLVSAMYRRSAIEAVGLFDKTFRHSEDMDLLFRLRGQGSEIGILPELVVYRRFHGGNLTAQTPEASPLLRSLRQKLAAERTSAKEATGE
jgi:glycosyltransferase involved in cell wall biosynthesis